MPELFLELFSEEIPARMQRRAAEDLARLVAEALAPLAPSEIRMFHGPRRIALGATVAPALAEQRTSERGPRRTAPEQALAGFLRKHNASREQLREEGDFLVLDRVQSGLSAAELIAREMPKLLRRFPWPKSMRWGTSAFTWVRPLRRIVCLLDGAVVPFDLRDGADEGHSLAASDQSEGHRFMAPGAFAVSSCALWEGELRRRHVIADAAERRALIAAQLDAAAGAAGLAVVEDAGLLDEVTGLVEWPVTLIGRIDDAFIDLPPEVMQVSMRVNQRYFALRHADGRAAPHFAFVANFVPADGGAICIAGNERVLRARFSDARHFWDLDRQRPLQTRLSQLENVTFHGKLGSQRDRVHRIAILAASLAQRWGFDVGEARQAAFLSKADLVTGLVGEFPELQGIIGSYYAKADGCSASVCLAIREHYLPRGPSDSLPKEPIGIVLAVADKIDMLASFFSVGERPTGSGDPFALRRAALGVIRILRQNMISLPWGDFLTQTAFPLLTNFVPPSVFLETGPLISFLKERLIVQIRVEGGRADVVAAGLGGTIKSGLVSTDFDVIVELARIQAITDFLSTPIGNSFLVGYRRASKILEIEERKDGTQNDNVDPSRFVQTDEKTLNSKISQTSEGIAFLLQTENFIGAMTLLAELREPLDAFFDRVTVNADDPELRRNRLRLLSRVRATMNSVADFSKIEGS